MKDEETTTSDVQGVAMADVSSATSLPTNRFDLEVCQSYPCIYIISHIRLLSPDYDKTIFL